MKQPSSFLQTSFGISLDALKVHSQNRKHSLFRNLQSGKAKLLGKMFLKGILLPSLFLQAASLYSSPSLENWETYRNEMLKVQPDFPGWCPAKKAKDIMDVIVTNHSQVCVELGVFGGSSFFPIAAALAYTQQGIAYAIDPWSNDACLEGYGELDEKLNNYWGTVDLEKVMNKFTSKMHLNDLDSYYSIMRMSSKEANPHFKDNSIDFLHIDGNHSKESALFDVKNWLPKVKTGGIVCFDDAWWDSTQPAIHLLLQECDLIEDLSSSWKQYIFLKKR